MKTESANEPGVVFGTDEKMAASREVRLGGLAFTIDSVALRTLTWFGEEVVRAISWPVRDENWITLTQEVRSESFDEKNGAAVYNLEFTVFDGLLSCSLQIEANAAGSICADLEMTAVEEFRTNRAGFTVLHPINGVAGEPLSILHPDGSVEDSTFPYFISPGQPAFDIAGLRHTVGSARVEIDFQGEIFEMEDQRNWSDASYKTYCPPLVLPFTYTIKEGETRRQRISIALTGGKQESARKTSETRIEFKETGELFPAVGLAVERGWIGSESDSDALRACRASHLLVRVGPEIDPEFLAEAAELSSNTGADIDLEFVIPGDVSAADYLEVAAESVLRADLVPARVVAMPEPYMHSYQPSGPWPTGPTPQQIVGEARRAFPGAKIGGGVLTNFTELNRCRPDADACDFISHGITAIVHVSDDRSAVEALESLPSIFKSATALGRNLPYRLGLVSIGMRSNPYGASVAPNPEGIRQAMAMHDPRHSSLFGAAWAVGALAATESNSVDSISLASPAGPFAIVNAKQPVPRLVLDDNPDAVVIPLFHVFRFAAGLNSRPRFSVIGLPAGLHSFAVAAESGRVDCVIANLGTRSADANFSGFDLRSCIMGRRSFGDALKSYNWVDASLAKSNGRIALEPFEVAFAEIEI
ncbi:MAG: hypothetical protein OXI87_24470 [Albidovulum sp.]|nr:hypothetical protein [Albidovulum sp.]